ncbi:hypothetical protein [Tardiphaga sp. 841_E9_N1_2]|uniref:hypothetical protein n=1 Tax=Tardiphaga sp. 841_E9_N1_2 TaxID=3240762 RepID=UPI003F255415
MMNVQPKFYGLHGPHPLVGALGQGSIMLMSGKAPDCGQSGSFGFGHGTRRVQSGLLVRHTFHQSSRFLIGADPGDVQNRFAVMGLYQALAVVHSNEAIHYPVSVVGELVLLPKLKGESSNDTSALKVGQAIGCARHSAPSRTFGGLHLSNLDGYCRRTFRVLVHALAKKLRQVGFGNRLLCHRSLPSGSNPSSKRPQPAVLAVPEVNSVLFQAVAMPQLLFYPRHHTSKLRKLPTLTGICQRVPIAAAVRDDCYASVAEVRPCELLVKHPDELVGSEMFFGHEGQLTASLLVRSTAARFRYE